MKRIYKLFIVLGVMIFVNTMPVLGLTEENRITIDELKETMVDNGDGLCKDDNQIDRYVFKGSNPNNYVTFNGEVAGWRIISIESDGTIKLVHNGMVALRSFDDTNLRSQGYCSKLSAFKYGCNAWSKFDDYSNTKYSGLVEDDSSLNKYLNTEYLASLTEEAQSFIVSHDFKVGSTKRDELTLEKMVEDESKYTWNGKIGLINPSDYIMANNNIDLCGTPKKNFNNESKCLDTNYLRPNGHSYWTMSPDSTFTYFPLIVRNSGRIYNMTYSNSSQEVWPVVFIKNDIELIGLGTSDEPYVIDNKKEVEEDKPGENTPTEDKPSENTPTEDNKPSENTPTEDNKPSENTPTEDNKPSENTPVEDNKPSENENLDDVPKTGDIPSLFLSELYLLAIISGCYIVKIVNKKD